MPPRRGKTHWLRPDGTIACNPRDREAAHRAAQSNLQALEDPTATIHLAITCAKCKAAHYRYLKREL